MQYCTKRNECESKIIYSQDERSSTFSHCHTLNCHSLFGYHIDFGFKCRFIIPLYVYEREKTPTHIHRCKREEKQSFNTSVFSLYGIVLLSSFVDYFVDFSTFVACLFSHVYMYIVFLFICGRFTVLGFLSFFILLLYSTFLNKCLNKISNM